MSYFNPSITNLEDVVTLLQQQNELITSQNTTISNLSDKVNALSVASSGSGIK